MSLTRSDLQSIAGLHKQGIPTGFLSSLGEVFLAKLYAGIDKAPGSCVIVERDESGEVIGFVSGTLSIRRCYRHVITRNLLSLGLRLGLRLLSPHILLRVFETLRYPLTHPPVSPLPFSFKKKGGGLGGWVNAELLSIAVSDSARGKGVGKRLVKALEAFFVRNGHAGPYKVVTWAEDKRSNAFYLGVGFTFCREFEHHGNKMREYRKDSIK
jgi:ribosomal protein S18 acetylase RimI-like enzyme